MASSIEIIWEIFRRKDRSLVNVGREPDMRSKSQSEMLLEFRWIHVGELSDVVDKLTDQAFGDSLCGGG